MSEVIKFLWNSPKECPKSVEEAGQVDRSPHHGLAQILYSPIHIHRESLPVLH